MGGYHGQGAGSTTARLCDPGSRFPLRLVAEADRQPLVRGDLCPRAAPCPVWVGASSCVACSLPAPRPAPPQPVAADGTEPLGRPVGALPSLRTRVAGTERGGPRPVPGHLPLQALEALLFLQARWRAPGSLSSHAVQLMRPGLAKVGSLEHVRPLHQLWLRPR